MVLSYFLEAEMSGEDQELGGLSGDLPHYRVDQVNAETSQVPRRSPFLEMARNRHLEAGCGLIGVRQRLSHLEPHLSRVQQHSVRKQAA